MTNQIAVFLGALILIGLGIDWQVYDWSHAMFLARRFIDLLEWMAFWR